MRTVLTFTTILSTLALAAGSALAQPEPEPAEDDLAGDEVELEPEPELDDDELLEDDPDAPSGAEEVPDAPHLIGEEAEARAAKEKAAADDGEYPIEVAARPLTLHAAMSEVALDIPVHVDPFTLTGLLDASYGATDDIEIGLRYGLGALTEDGFETGKVVAIDGLYRIEDWIAAQLTIPLMVDPFALGVTVGAPMKFRFLDDTLALTFGRDLLDIKLNRFVPVVDDPARSDALVEADEIGTVVPDGNLRFIGSLIYQLDSNLAIEGELGLVARDFALTDAPFPMQVILWYSSSNTIDLGGRLGFTDAGEGTEGLFAAVFAAIRI